MVLTTDARHTFINGFGNVVTYRIRIYEPLDTQESSGWPTLASRRECPDEPLFIAIITHDLNQGGPSFCNHAEPFAAQIRDMQLARWKDPVRGGIRHLRSNFVWIEHLLPRKEGRAPFDKEEFTLVTFDDNEAPELKNPRWADLSRQNVEAMIGRPLDDDSMLQS